MDEVWLLFDMSQGWSRLIAVYDSDENAQGAAALWRATHNASPWSVTVLCADIRRNNAIPITEYPDDEVTQ